MNKSPEKRDEPKTMAEKGQPAGKIVEKNVPTAVRTFCFFWFIINMELKTEKRETTTMLDDH